MLDTTTKLASWQAVLEFLSAPYFTKEPKGPVVIFKNQEAWTVEIISSLQKRKHIALTTRSRGVGLFDLNW